METRKSTKFVVHYYYKKQYVNHVFDVPDEYKTDFVKSLEDFGYVNANRDHVLFVGNHNIQEFLTYMPMNACEEVKDMCTWVRYYFNKKGFDIPVLMIIEEGVEFNYAHGLSPF